jgi:hypothetical protein
MIDRHEGGPVIFISRRVRLIVVTGALMLVAGISGASVATPAGALAQATEPTVDITVESGTFDPRTGSVTIIGTATCPAGAEAYVHAGVTQSAGGRTVSAGPLRTSFVCEGMTQTWSGELTAARSRFTGGKAYVYFDYTVVIDDGYVSGAGSATIKLKGR